MNLEELAQEKMSLEQLLQLKDMENHLVRRFLQQLINHGGSLHDLHRFVHDCRTDATFLARFAKEIVGNIWKLTEQEVVLGDIDFDCPAAEFVKRYRGVRVQGADSYFRDFAWTESRPHGPCKYVLRHFERPTSVEDISEIAEASFDSLSQPAGWRELVAYVFRLSKEDFSSCLIGALGSRLCQANGDGVINLSRPQCPPDFPQAYFNRDTRVVLPNRNPKTLYTPRYFWLTRVYSN